MKEFGNNNVKLSLLKEHNDTFLFHQLLGDASTDHAIRLGRYFNKQSSGFRVKDVMSDIKLSKLIEPLATFDGSGQFNKNNSLVEHKDKPYQNELEFVAIAEGKSLPLYIFTYNVEMTQFVATDISKQPE